MGISLVIPVYNEQQTIRDVISLSKHNVDEIIVVDNNSNDDTVKIAKELGAKILTNPERGNVGKSIEMGINSAKGDLIAIIDADMEIDPRDLKKLVDLYRKTKASMIIGKRTELPRMGERIISDFFEVYYGVSDILCGLKLFERRIVSDLKPYSTYPNYGLDFVYEAIKKGYKVINCDVKTMSKREDARLGNIVVVERKMLDFFIDFLNRYRKSL